jgi:glycosyltransferase involved in cell wall biosynthesis
MKLLVAMEGRFQSRGDEVFSHHLSYDIFWKNYLEIFDQVVAIARVKPAEKIPERWLKASGAGVSFCPLPDYRGHWQFLGVYPRLKKLISGAIGESDAYLIRVPGMVGTMVRNHLPPGTPYGVEVVTDPYDLLAPGLFESRWRPFFRWWFVRQLRKQCRGAAAAAYVTGERLQRRYPPAPGAFVTSYSTAHLADSAFAAGPRSCGPGGGALTLIFVGMVERLYKGPDLLIEALRLCREKGLDLSLVIVGEGRRRPELERLAARLGLREKVYFRGALAGAAEVRSELDRADLFVLPSRAEGLPRAMLEAMARGLPCIGSTVGGIPELLPAEDLVPPGDVPALARKIGEAARAPRRLERMSARNLRTAREYRQSLLRVRRMEFYRVLREKAGKGSIKL